MQDPRKGEEDDEVTRIGQHILRLVYLEEITQGKQVTQGHIALECYAMEGLFLCQRRSSVIC